MIIGVKAIFPAIHAHTTRRSFLNAKLNSGNIDVAKKSGELEAKIKVLEKYIKDLEDINVF